MEGFYLFIFFRFIYLQSRDREIFHLLFYSTMAKMFRVERTEVRNLELHPVFSHVCQERKHLGHCLISVPLYINIGTEVVRT